jgi:RNA polymerase sigma factor (sigma-70 family)
MTRTQGNAVLRHIRGLAAAEESDGQLLERFAAAREEAAFAALVRRHGPLVLGVCRRVLHQEQDAEDAFQATFLALARKAASAGRRATLGTWLYQVAYHAALRVRQQSALRRRREDRTPPRPRPDLLAEVTGRELLTVLDEELHRLPERCRAPLVLCYLEGRTRDEAARELGWSLGTLKRRLEQGRVRLHDRLSRRGVALAGLLAAGAGVTAVSPTMAAATARLVAAGNQVAVPARVASLTAAGLRAVAAVRRKAVGAALLAATLIALGAGLAYQGSAPAAGEPPRADANAPKGAATAEKNESTVAGRVVDADGKPVSGAVVTLVGMPKSRNTVASGWLEHKALARGTAGADGRFRLTLADETRAKYQGVYAVAGKEGHGMTWEQVPVTVEGAETVLRLPPEKVLRGRVLDLQGVPIAGADVSVEWVGTIAAKQPGGVGLGKLAAGDFPAWPEPKTTDKDGKFVLRGLNPDFGGYLRVEGADFAPQSVEIKVGDKAQELSLSLTPAQVLAGVVTAEDTGKPVAGARVDPWSGGSALTDEKGRYRIKLPRASSPSGRSHSVSVTAPDDQPYLLLETEIAWPKGAIRHEQNLALKRGVLVRGKVTEVGSGRPVAGALVFDAAHLWMRNVKSGADGTFRIAVAPGRSNLLVKGPDNNYVATQVTHDELSGGKPAGHRLYPDAVIPLDLKAEQREADVTAKLRRGVTVRGRLLGPDGRPAAESVLLCWNQLRPDVASWFAAGVPVRDGTFELRGCDPDETYPVHFLDGKNRLGATVRVSPKEVGDGTLTVRLQPCGKAVVRFVDKEGKPAPGFSPYVNVVVRPGGKGFEADSDFVANVDRLNYTGASAYAADADGRCTLPALIPGVAYRLYSPRMKEPKEVVVKPGETLDVGDVVLDQ